MAEQRLVFGRSFFERRQVPARDHQQVQGRLRRIEGQARGIQQMVQDDRYCLDVVQQVNALTAAARQVALLVLEDHVRGCVSSAVNEDERDAAIKEMMTVLGKAMRQ